MNTAPTFGSLFAGIGGIDLGLERAGWECRWQVEIDDYCQRVLAKHWPDVRRYKDVREVGRDNLETVDLISGGFPCQPVSIAGKRKGQSDSRWLWPAFARVVSELRPRFVFVENVPGLLHRGMGDVLVDLAASGYDAEWDCIPASAFGAPHKRDRVWLVAYSDSRTGRREQRVLEQPNRQERQSSEDGGESLQPQGWEACDSDTESPSAVVAYANSQRLGKSPAPDKPDTDAIRHNPTQKQGRNAKQRATISDGEDVAYAPCIFSPESWRTRTGRQRFGDRGLRARNRSDTDYWATEPDVGRVAYGISARVDRLRGLGNAVVPVVAQWIGERIMECHLANTREQD